MHPGLLDVLIIGGGPAGLAVATGLARQLYTAVIFDSGVYRNARTKHMHNVPTWDHRDPADFRAKARADLLARYDTIKIEQTRIESVRRLESYTTTSSSRNSSSSTAATTSPIFEATDANGKVWTARKLILAAGVRDVYPDIPGYDDVWARGVYHCLFCDGYEDRGSETAGVLAIGDVAHAAPALHLARMAKRLAKRVTIYTDGAAELHETLLGKLGDDPVISLNAEPVAKLSKLEDAEEDVVVHLKDGTKIQHGIVVHKPKIKINGPFVEQLGLQLTDMALIHASAPWYETSVPGVFAVGDCASPMPAVTNALAMGAFAAGGLVGQLGAEPASS